MICTDTAGNVKTVMKIYKRDKYIYNIYPYPDEVREDSHECEIDKEFRLTGKQAGEILEKNIKHIKKTVKNKIDTYKPLDFKTAFNGFLQWIRDEGFKVIGEMPANDEEHLYLDELIKNFLIENAYYALAKKYIPRIIMNKLANWDPNDIRVHDVVDFVRERLEKDGLKKIKTFQEKSKFITFLTAAVNRLYIDSWRQQGTKEDKETKYEEDIEDSLHPGTDDPFTRLIKLEDEALKDKAAALLPHILAGLDYKEKLVIKLKYEKNMKISAIARTLGRTRFKTGQLIKQVEQELKTEILSVIKKGGNHETPGR